MHPALSIVEILDLILQSVRDKRTMLQFALTSRAFFEFGIKNLWKTRPSPLAIFPLLPWMRQGADPKLDVSEHLLVRHISIFTDYLFLSVCSLEEGRSSRMGQI